MFWKKLKKKATEKHNYDLTYDNVAIPEVHTHKPEDHEETPGEDAPVHYDNVAIPEVHIRRKKYKTPQNQIPEGSGSAEFFFSCHLF